ncbi:hypothetical protein [Litorimonas sp. WD9-15]|uniref:hypothetical protein n=1 Tax=Litorimonas sp. WD9-15 TaxID=3418716 RepID=UPI003CFD2DC0
MFRLIFVTSLLLVPVLAFAHPHKTPDPEDEIEIIIVEDDVMSGGELTDKLDEKLSKHRVIIAKSMSKVKRNLDKNQAKADGDFSEEVEAVAEALEEVFADDGLFKDLTLMFSDFAGDVDVEREDGVTVLKFDGATVGKIAKSKTRNSEDSLSISGLGQNLTLDRETIVEDGKSKTRIVIEMEGGDEIDITLPKLDEE